MSYLGIGDIPKQVEESVFDVADGSIFESEKTPPTYSSEVVFSDSNLQPSALSKFRFFNLFGYSSAIDKKNRQEEYPTHNSSYWRIHMRFFISCMVLTHAVLFCCENQPCLRALIVQDCSKTDVQIASAADAVRVKEAFAYIASQTGLHFQPTVIKAHELSKKAFQKWLKTIRPSKNEVALFYYSGQGTNTKKSKWPSITLGKGFQLDEEGVAKQIKAAKPKLGVIVFDCYNRVIPAQNACRLQRLPTLDLSKPRPLPGLKNIFRANKGIVLACSSPKVDRAFYSVQEPPIGGIFTTQFLLGLFGYTRDAWANWHNVRFAMNEAAGIAHIKFRPLFEDRARGGTGGGIIKTAERPLKEEKGNSYLTIETTAPIIPLG